MARNYRSNRNNRGASMGSNPPPPPNNNAGSGGTNPQPPANTNILAQTILAYLQGAHIMAKVYKLYLGLFIGIVVLYASQFAAGAIDFNHGHGFMAMFELIIVLVILFVWFLPHILITGGVVATAAALNSPNLLTDEAVIKTATFWVKGFLSVCAYTVGIVFTVLLLFNIKNDYNGLAILIVVGTFIGIFTVVIGDAGTLTPKLMRAGLVGFVVMILLTYLPGVNGESVVRDFLVTHNVLAGIATFVVIVVGTSNLGTFKDWSWSKLSWLLSVRNLLKLIGFALFLFAIYWFFNPKDATRILSAKVTEIQDATTSMPTPPSASDQSHAGKATLKITGGSTGQKVVMGNQFPNQSCTTPVRLDDGTFQFKFTPTLETLNSPPEIGTIGPGRYMVTASGVRTQNYYGNGAENPPSDHTPQDADGIMKDRPGNLTFINGTNASEVLFPEKPYAAFVIGLGNVNFFAGSKLFFTVKDPRIITPRLNVIPRLDPGTGSFMIKLYKCK
ncbi:MAG: hypothetical protein WCW14_04435 [Candidatus Paceibacterota bacterium]|jgi:hypothetical protein